MIEFSGNISGKTEKHYLKKIKDFAAKLIFFSMLCFLPIVLYFTVKLKFTALIIGYGVLIIAAPLLAYIPQNKREIRQQMPIKVYTEDEYIITVNAKEEEYKLIADVKRVNEFDEFYELVFPFGKVSQNFICQKDLLTKGTLEEFEVLFEGKIVKSKCFFEMFF